MKRVIKKILSPLDPMVGRVAQTEWASGPFFVPDFLYAKSGRKVASSLLTDAEATSEERDRPNGVRDEFE